MVINQHCCLPLAKENIEHVSTSLVLSIKAGNPLAIETLEVMLTVTCGEAESVLFYTWSTENALFLSPLSRMRCNNAALEGDKRGR